MTNEHLTAQMETYSNAIVGFAVLQALAFSYSFGTNQFFNCLVKTSPYLPHAIATHFLVGTILACYATIALGRLVRQLSRENTAIVRRIYLAKCAVVILFTSMPFFITVNYGLLADTGGECRQVRASNDHAARLPAD